MRHRLASLTLCMLPLSACSVESETTADDLAGTRWQLGEWNHAGQLVELADPTLWTLDFATGAISGRSGCNQFHGRIEASNGKPVIQVLGSSRMLCEKPVMQLERHFQSGLAGTTRIEKRDDERLVIDYPEGEMTFRAVED